MTTRNLGATLALVAFGVGITGLIAVLTFDGQASVPTSSTVQYHVTAFTNTNVLSMNREGILPNHTVVVRGDRIVDIGPTGEVVMPADATIIDGSGKYLMPGLVEMHGHMPGGELEEIVMFLYVANGITTVRGMLGQDQHLALRDRANSGRIVAPTLYMAGPSFNGNSVNSPAEAAAKVRQQKTEGWDLLKVHPGLTLDEYDAMANTAHEVGIRFGGHVPADVGLRHAIEMGQETFDHLDGYIEYLDAFDKAIDPAALDQIVRLTRDAGAAVVPTMVLWDLGIIGMGETEDLLAFPELRYWPDEGTENWRGRQADRAQARKQDPDRAQIWFENRQQVLKALADGGVTILMGTDSPQIFSVPGFSLHREMEAMAAAGMSNWDILVSGTTNVGEYFQRQDTFGTIAVGRRADLLLLDANPMDDIGNVRDRAGVMVRGEWIGESDIQARLAEIAARFGH
jgi:imidazolonepropionase-like amidohydrolase